MKRLPWYPWYTGEWLTETRGWSLVERGLYRELLDAQWDRGILPASVEELRAVANATSREWQRAWPRVSVYFPRVPGGRQNIRLTQLRREQEALRARRRAAAEQTNRKRWGSLSESLSDSKSESPNPRRPTAQRQNSNINSREDSPQRRDGSHEDEGSRQ